MAVCWLPVSCRPALNAAVNFELAAKTGRSYTQLSDLLPPCSVTGTQRSPGLPQPCLSVAEWQDLPASTLLYLWSF